MPRRTSLCRVLPKPAPKRKPTSRSLIASRASRVSWTPGLAASSEVACSTAAACVKCTTYAGACRPSISSARVSARWVIAQEKTSGTGRSAFSTTAVGRPLRRVRSAATRVDVPERRRHQHELRLGQLEQRDLPSPAAVGLGVEVELVHHDEADVGVGALAQRDVREHLRGAADDRCLGVHGCVAGQHPDVRRPEDLAVARRTSR